MQIYKEYINMINMENMRREIKQYKVIATVTAEK